MFFLLISLAFGEPLIAKVEQGDKVPFDGRLFNDEAVSTVLADSEAAVQQCEIRKDLEWKTQMAEALVFRHSELMDIKDEEIDLLRRHSSPRKTMWMFLGGFTAGTAASLATYYAVNQISEN